MGDEIMRNPPPETDRTDRDDRHKAAVEMARRTMGILEDYNPVASAQARLERGRAEVDRMEGRPPAASDEDMTTNPVHPHWYIPVLAEAVRKVRQKDALDRGR